MRFSPFRYREHIHGVHHASIYRASVKSLLTAPPRVGGLRFCPDRGIALSVIRRRSFVLPTVKGIALNFPERLAEPKFEKLQI